MKGVPQGEERTGPTRDLFLEGECALVGTAGAPASLVLAAGAMVLRGHARAHGAALWSDLQAVITAAPWRHLITPGGRRMSVAMTNCGALGWVSDRRGYRYDALDPDSGRPWPAMPASLAALAGAAAAAAGYAGFAPQACLVNRYAPGARLTLHQDRDELDLRAPIVSVSMGLPATFLFGGPARSDACQRVPLLHGDVVVWGGPSRLHHHGVLAVKAGHHAMTGECRINLTFRRVR